MFDYRRTHDCGSLNAKQIGENVTLSGWVHRRRDHGGLIFIDLRDRFGITQLVFDPKIIPAAHEAASRLRMEWVISIKGEVIPRAAGMTNPKLVTGAIEIQVKELEILSPAKTPPFSISDEESDVNEEIRLKYRYLDIRRGSIAKKLILRHKATLVVRNHMDKQGFIEIQTPLLAKSTPEGARDYLVPSRVYPGNFYALPQSPQIFKQLLMVGGMDRYFQIAPCFRDEDLRADRQPEFTQIDIEMSFCTPHEIRELIENLLKEVFKECTDRHIEYFPHMTHKDCLEHYGTDRPDLRFGMPLVRLDDIVKNSTFSVFLQELDCGGTIKALCVKRGVDLSRKDIEQLTSFISKFGVSGLAWMKKTEEGWSSNIVKFFTEEQLNQIESRMSATIGDLLLFGAGPEERINQGLDHLRRHIAKLRNLISQDDLKFLWVTEFPMFKYNVDEKRLESEHHPFTSPHADDIALLETDPLKMRAEAYDLVLNGYELGGGSQRIHNGELQEKIFETLKLSKEQIKEKFGFFVDALKYGTPPHLGIALGLDRLIMILTKTENIRDVIAFPKTQKASDLMLQAPSKVAKDQLKELEILCEPTEITWI